MYFSRNKFIKFIMVVILILIIIFTLLNIYKFRDSRDVKEVWSQEGREYYFEIENNSFFHDLSKLFNWQEVIYRLTQIRLNVPVTYLKREIPLLAHYTPRELQESGETIYYAADPSETETSQDSQDNIMRFQFDLREEDKPQDEEADGVPDDETALTKESKIVEERDDLTEDIEKTAEPQKSNIFDRLPLKEPLVAIYHTHTAETYIDDPRQRNGHVSPGDIGHVAKVGERLSQTLSNKYNINTYHTTRVHDTEYSRAYGESRETVEKIIDDFSNLNMIFDIHRDALDQRGREAYTTEINDEKVARVMLVVTTGRSYSGLDFRKPEWDWQQNYRFATRLAERMEEMYPGLLQGEIRKRGAIFNQDFHENALLMEIGDYRNTTGEALRSAELMADVIASLIYEGYM